MYWLLSSIIKLLAALSNIWCGAISSPQPQGSGYGSKPSTFKAAVYEHIPFLPIYDNIYTRTEALALMRKNLDVYKIQTRKAKQQGVQILVFPEDGIYGMVLKTKKAIRPFLETIPDPKVIRWSPCGDPTRYPDTQVQQALSCMAKENGLYLVANMGDLVPCNVTRDPKCPPTGHYQYNTDVAYDPQGQLVAKYHKTHLFYETQFDTPKPEVVYFDTPFGRFGMLVCFDLLFKEPAVTMVTDHGVTNIVFPTAWMDSLPLLSAIGYHSSFARGLGVNFLSANIHLPTLRFHGSGIYTPTGMASFYYSDNLLSPGKLLVSTIGIILPDNSTAKHFARNNQGLFNTITNDLNSTGDEFQSKLFDDTFTFKVLEDSSGTLNVCQKNVCCSLAYNISQDRTNGFSQELFAFGVFDGLHTREGQYYFQICTLVKCAKNGDRTSCGAPTTISDTKFESLSISGRFQTRFVYPQVVMSQGGQMVLGDQGSWNVRDNVMTSGPGLDRPLLTAALFGRYYIRDDGKSGCEA